ncbi:MAG: hypothetical protein LBT24_02745 [Tannerella sp.]|jgi:hypothetical protein|nr:hypothetical protein [Tannerella sp.]
MKRLLLSLIFTTFSACFSLFAQEKRMIEKAEKTLGSQWDGKKAAYLGDSMTDPDTKATTVWYWQYLKELMNIDYYVYARSGYEWDGIYRMAEKLYPLSDAFTQYFTNEKTDRLHPNANGHYRIAKTIQYQLVTFPAETPNRMNDTQSR